MSVQKIERRRPHRGAAVGFSLLVSCLGAASAAAQHHSGNNRPTREFRPIDGFGTNANHARWGAAGSRYLREDSGAHYADGLNAMTGAGRPSARMLSNALADQGGLGTEDERGLSTCWYEFGQFLDHDFGLALGAGNESCAIAIPTGDPYFDPAGVGNLLMGMTRSGFDPVTGVTSPRQQVNTVTSFIDASHVYGSDPVRAEWLREHAGGRLRVDAQAFGDFLPLNDGTMANDNPVGRPVTSLRVAGDVRANEQIGLTALHTVFLREHNWQAARLAAAHPTWSDERLYQEARKIVGAEMQVITYREFVPALLGHELPAYRGYKPWVNPGLSNAFATAAYRIGHSMVGDDVDLLDENFEATGIVELADAFFNPDIIPEIGGIDSIVRYFVVNKQQKTDTMIVDPLRNFLFGAPGAGGLDLAALNIQRGRDHGLGDYNTVRVDFGLPPVTQFSEITSDPAVAQTLQEMYITVDEIDPWVGMLAEDHLPGASVGQTHAAVFIDQFTRLRDGDRFWYQNNQFNAEALGEIESTRLAVIFARTTGVVPPARNVFFAATIGAPPCAPDINASGDLTVQDVFDFLTAYFTGDALADFNASGAITSQDIFDFLAAYFTGCN